MPAVPSDLQNLLNRRSAIYTELGNLSSSNPGGRPNISGGGIGSVDHMSYKRELYAELKDLNIQIDMLQGPWEQPLTGMPG